MGTQAIAAYCSGGSSIFIQSIAIWATGALTEIGGEIIWDEGGSVEEAFKRMVSNNSI